MKKLLFCLIPFALFALAGCGGGAVVTADRTLPDIFNSAYQKLDDKDYAGAATDFQEAENTFPTSEWAADAEMMAMYSLYMDDDFPGALLVADRFMRFHPGHQNVAYVLYLRGMSYYRQVSDVRRDPGMSVYAMQAFNQLIDRFPKSEYAENARNKVIILQNYIAGKEMYSARRDMERSDWTAAITTLQGIVTNAEKTQMTAEALFRLNECYTAIGLPDQAAGFAEMLRKNFPDSNWAEKLDK